MKRKASYFKIFLLGFGFFGLSVLWSLYNSDIPIMLKNVYNLSYSASGWVMNLDNILAITLIPLVGFWSDHVWTHIGRRMPFIISTLPIGGLLFALVPWIPLWLGASATSLTTFILVLFFVNICMGISRSPIIALMPDLVPPEERSPANGVINFMGGFGSLLVYFVVGKISTTNRPLGFAIAGASVLVAAVVMFLSINETRDSLDREAPQSEHADFSLLRTTWTPKYRSLLLICLAIFFWFIAFNAVETYYPTYMHYEGPAVKALIDKLGTATPTDSAAVIQLEKVRQTSEASAKFNLGVFSLAFMLLAIPAGFIGKALGRKTTMLIGLVGVTIMVLLLAFGIASTAGLVVFLMGGLSWALVNINSLPTVLDMGNLEMVGALTGVYYFFSQAASIVSPPLIGRIADLAGGTMSIMFPYAGIFFVLAAVCVLFMHTEDRPVVSSDQTLADNDLTVDNASAASIHRQAGSDVACLLLHGLTGAPSRDLWFLADYLSGHGISVVAPLLTGHGKTWKELELATSESWQHDALAGLNEARTMGKTVFVAGLSMGGTLTLYLGEHRPEIAGLITINAPVYVDDPKMKLVPILRHFRRNQPKGPPDVADQDARLPDLSFNSLEAVYQFERLMQGVREDLGMVTQPLLSFRSTQDHVVPPRNAEYIVDHINSRIKSVVTLEHSYHLATIDYDRERIAIGIEQFIALVRKQQI